MKDEPNIIKQLRNEEKQGKLRYKSIDNSSSKQSKKPNIKLNYKSTERNVNNSSLILENEEKSFCLEYLENEDFYRTLIENVLEGILIIGFGGSIIYANPAAVKTFGFKTLKDFKSENLFNFIDEKFKNKIVNQKSFTDIKDENLLSVYQIFTIEDRKIWIEAIGTKINYMGNDAIVIFTRDVTERKQIEESLIASTETFRQLYDKAPIPYHTLSPSGIITNVNEKWCKTFGFKKNEVLGKSIFDFVVNKEMNEAKSSFLKKIKEKKSYTGGHERKYVTKNNEERIFIIHDYLLFDNRDKVISVHTTMEDITQRQQLWDNIVKSEEKYRVLAETSADGVLTTDVLGRLTYINPSLEKILGRRKSKILATPFKNYLSESTVFLYQQAFLDIRKKGKKMENISLDVLHNDGYEIPIEANMSPLNKNGKFIGIECTVRDVSERRKIERELKRSEKLRTEFMNIAAHELKSPITPIKGYLELIESNKDSNEKIKNWARIGMRNADRLMRLVNDILDVSRLDTNTMRFNMEKLDIKEILNNAIEDIKPDVENKKLKLIIDIPKELPKILCDNYRLSQVLKNLLGNAIKFTDYGSISLKAEKKDNTLFIYVEDTGIGISNDETKKIFTKFYQAYTGEDRKNEGTGLGLFICKEIVKKHNGEIWAESKVGKGSKFIIEIPI